MSEMVASRITSVVGPMLGSPTEDEAVDSGLEFNIRVSKFYGYKVVISGPVGKVYDFTKRYRRWKYNWEWRK